MAHRSARPSLVACLALALAACPPPSGAGDGGTGGGAGGGGGGGPATVCGDGARQGGEQCDDGNTTGGDGCEADCTLSDLPGLKGCPGLEGPPPAGDACTATPGDGGLLVTGVVLGAEAVYVGGQVLVDPSGVVTCVGCGCAPDAGPAPAVVACPGAVVSPGLINAHDHISYQAGPAPGSAERYEHRNDWRTGANGHTVVPNGGTGPEVRIRWAELRQLLSGTTSVVGATYSAAGNAGLLRNLDAPPAGQLGNVAGAAGVSSDTFPLGDSAGLELWQGCAYPKVPGASAVPADAAYLPHVGEGLNTPAHNEVECVSQGSAGTALGHRTAVVHGIGVTGPDVALLAATGTALVWSPRSNVSLYGETAPLALYVREGVTVALGTDWTISGSMNLLRELKCADHLDRTRFGTALGDRGLWRTVTAGAADATATSASLGRLRAGALGDLAVFRRRAGTPYRSVVDAEPQDVLLTARGGKVLFGDQAAVGPLDLTGSCEALEVCGAARRVCLQGELTALTGATPGLTLAQLQAANADAYPLFACGGPPPGEPSCEPERGEGNSHLGSTLYSAASPDADHDGVPDDVDDCPTVFNPVRPMDLGRQLDTDGDGVGDACDPCPLTPGTTACAPFDPADRDGDGLPNTEDDCPEQGNPDQADADGDGKGDACDPCPAAPNPGLQACPATVYAVKTGQVPVGPPVSLEGVLVTAVGSAGYFVQVPDDAPGFAGRDWSGLYVYQAGAGVQVGDRLLVLAGSVSPYFGQLQLAGTGTVDAGVVVLSRGSPLMAPVPVSAAAVAADDGGLATRLEGVLVQVQGPVEVTLVQPPPGSGDRAPTNEFELAGALRVNDLFHLASPFPVLEQQYASLTGVLEWRFGGFRLEPRSAADLVAGPPVVVGLEPALVYVREGSTAVLPGPLTVRFATPGAGPAWVAAASDGPGQLEVTDGGVLVPAGQASAPLALLGLASTDGGTVTVTAQAAAGRAHGARVRVLSALEPARLLAVEPARAVAEPGAPVAVTVRLDAPAPAATEVALALQPAGFGTLPTSVTVPADALTAVFTLTLGAVAEGQVGTLTATLGGDQASATVTAGSLGASHLVISEVAAAGPAGAADEFVELHNPTSAAVDLSGFTVQYLSAAFNSGIKVVLPAGASIGPHRYFLVSGPTYAGAHPALAPDYQDARELAFSGTAGHVQLLDAAGAVVDRLGYGTGATQAEGGHPAAGPASGSQSYERKARASSTAASMAPGGADETAGNGRDSDDNAADFVVRAVREPQNAASPAEPP